MGVENSILDRLRFGERPFSTVLEYLNCVCLRIDCKNDCCMHVHSRDNRDIRRTLNSTPGPSRLDTMHISRYNTGIEVVSSAKLLGVVVSDNLRWNAHVESICKKAATRLYFLYYPRICYFSIQHVYAVY